MAGLLHDLGKATTLADGHFIGHEWRAPGRLEEVLRRLRLPRTDAAWIVRLVRQHMFAYTPDWTDAAVRRFIRRVGSDLLDDLFALRAADNAASGAASRPREGSTSCAREWRRCWPATRWSRASWRSTATTWSKELGLAPGPRIGELLGRLLDAVLDDPSQNTRERLLALARSWQSEPGASAHRQDGGARDLRGADDGPAATIGDPGAVPTLALRPSPTRRISAP